MDQRDNNGDIDLQLDKNLDASAKVTFNNGREEIIGFNRLFVVDDDIFIHKDGKKWLKDKLNSLLPSGEVLLANYSQISSIRVVAKGRGTDRSDKGQDLSRSFQRRPSRPDSPLPNQPRPEGRPLNTVKAPMAPVAQGKPPAYPLAEKIGNPTENKGETPKAAV